MKTQGISVLGYTNIEVKVRLAQSRAGAGSREQTDYIEIQATFDNDRGDALPDTGNWTVVGRFIGDAIGADLKQDTDLNGTPDGAALTTTFTEYSFPVPGNGTLLAVRIVQHSSGTEEAAFDTVCVTANLGAFTATGIEQLLDSSILTTFSGAPGQTYLLQSTDSLINTNWTDVTTLLADALGTIIFTNAASTELVRFYRIVLP